MTRFALILLMSFAVSSQAFASLNGIIQVGILLKLVLHSQKVTAVVLSDVYTVNRKRRRGCSI